jgi:hypothetical protein
MHKYKIIPVEVNNHESLTEPGTIRNDFNPFTYCFSPTLLCGTQKIYPCCRAHLFEQMHKKNYHLDIKTPDLYSGLMRIIQKSDLCLHCPRLYKDNKILPCRKGKIECDV